MRLWKMEFYKITARPVMNLGFLLILGFLILVFYQEVDASRTEIDGKVYQGLEAIQMDRKLAKEYEGIFTMEKAEDIVERFGFSGYVGEGTLEEITYEREGNYCSQFVTDKMTDFMQEDRRPTDFSTGEAWENYGKYYITGDVFFSYANGWKKLVDVWNMGIILLQVWLILMIAPVFSEEYSRNTTGILLSSKHGKSKDIWTKMMASLSLGGISYLVMVLLLTGMTIAVYGTDGLHANPLLIGDMFWAAGSRHWTAGGLLAAVFLEGLTAVFLNVCIMLFLSSRCRRPVTAVTAGALVFFLPAGINQVLFQILLSLGAASSFPGWLFLDVMRISCLSFPIYLPFLESCGVPMNWLAYVPVIVLVLIGFCTWRTIANYRNYQLS